MQTYTLTTKEISNIIYNMGLEPVDANSFRHLARKVMKNRKPQKAVKHSTLTAAQALLWLLNNDPDGAAVYVKAYHGHNSRHVLQTVVAQDIADHRGGEEWDGVVLDWDNFKGAA